MNAIAGTAAIVLVLGAAHLAAGMLVPLLVAGRRSIAFPPVAARGGRPVVARRDVPTRPGRRDLAHPDRAARA